MTNRSTAALGAAALLATACAAVTTPDGERLGMGSKAFRAYVESVFRGQNEVATELTFAFEEEGLSDADYAALESAESELLHACEGLNEIAAARRDRAAFGKLEAAKAARRAPECELATRDARNALASVREQSADRD